MKLKVKYYLSIAALLLLYLFLKKWNLNLVYEKDSKVEDKNVPDVKLKNVELEEKVTLILRYTQDTSIYLAETVNSFMSEFPHMSIIIVSDVVIPNEVTQSFINTTGVINIPLKLDLLNLVVNRNVASYVQTEYVFIVPVGVISFPPHDLSNLVKASNQNKDKIIVIPVQKRNFKCLKLELNLLQWTMQYNSNDYGLDCDFIQGYHGIFMYSKLLQKIGEPFMLPFPEAFFIQTATQHIKLQPFYDLILNIKQNNFTATDFSMRYQLQRQIMNKQFKIKKVIRENGLIEWYGCTRNTHRCFPDVINSVPEYIKQGRWTPPCCLKVLRETVHHVFKVLREWNVTFWLEGGSLLGAVRMKNIIPWDYDVDIGVYLEDVEKCPWLKIIQNKKIEKNQLPSTLDNEGYVWEKASPEEGNFYRVQASVQNHLHVDIFPFYSKNGIMTKDTWFASHPQDMEFPEHYLKPLTTIEFAGIQAPAPNNVKEFLEFKFGKGCVENPQYPNPKLFPFPDHAKKLVINETYNYDLSLNSS